MSLAKQRFIEIYKKRRFSEFSLLKAYSLKKNYFEVIFLITHPLHQLQLLLLYRVESTFTFAMCSQSLHAVGLQTLLWIHVPSLN